MTERCDPPVCVRVLGHDGECKPHWWRREICGRQIPSGPCARLRGHRSPCESRMTMDRRAERKSRMARARYA